MRVQANKTHTWDSDRIVVSFRIDKKLWYEFDEYLTERYGNYKKSLLIESLIEKYMAKKTTKEPYITNNNY